MSKQDVRRTYESTVLALLLSLGTMFALQLLVQVQAEQELPVSIDRIRASLKRAARLCRLLYVRRQAHIPDRGPSQPFLFYSQLTKNHSIPHTDCRQ